MSTLLQHRESSSNCTNIPPAGPAAAASPFDEGGGGGGGLNLAAMLMPTQQQEAQVRAIIESKKDAQAKQGWRTGRWSEEVGRSVELRDAGWTFPLCMCNREGKDPGQMWSSVSFHQLMPHSPPSIC